MGPGTLTVYNALIQYSGQLAAEQQDPAVLKFKNVEEVCESKSITLVVHPAIRLALSGYEETFYMGLRSFQDGSSDGIFFLPLQGSYVRLRFSQRHSSGGCPILRVDPLISDELHRIKAAVATGH